MKLLLDTHAFVWAAISPRRLSAIARAALQDRSNTVLLSAVSIYEIEFKRERDSLLARLPNDLPVAALQQGLDLLPVSPGHAQQAGRLPRHHGDPFDRLLIAQAIEEGAVLITSDHMIVDYAVMTLW